MPVDPSKSFLKLYTGLTDDFEEFLYLDLVIPNRHISLWVSPDNLDNCNSSDLLKYIGDALNEASLYTRNLGIRLSVDTETIVELSEDFSYEERKSINQLIKGD